MLTFTDALGNVTTLSSGVWSATGIGNPAGGTITYPLSGSPIAVGTTLTLQRVVPFTQPTDLSDQGGLWPTVVMGMSDNLEYQVQQLAEVTSRALVISVSETGPVQPLPPAVVRASQYLTFDSAGNPTTGAPVADATVSSAMQPVVDAATTALAAAALGVLTVPEVAALIAAAIVSPALVSAGILGEIRSFAVGILPAGWQFVYGQTRPRTDPLWVWLAANSIAWAWGNGDGETTYTMPDLRGRAMFGQDNMGGSAANRLTSGVSGIVGTTLGATGGDQRAPPDTTLVSVVDEGAGHTHGTNATQHGVNGASNYILGGATYTQDPATNSLATTGLTVATSSSLTGTGANVPPAAIVIFGMYVGA